MKTPVVFIIFNRPDTTKQVFETIRQVKPSQLFIIADGARMNQPQDKEKCNLTRQIAEKIDWNCQVSKNYSDINLGCAQRVSSGLDWVFKQVEEAIILEDDCLPDLTFFRFCEDLLHYYRNDNRIAVISGQNTQFGRKRTNYSYYFSRYNHCWGWATWRQAWQYFDFDMSLWNDVKNGDWLKDILEDKQTVKDWEKIFQNTYDELVDSWAIRWTFACWLQNYLSILSNVNLVSNIGFGQQSTHTKSAKSKFASLPTQSLDFPLQHPPFMIRDTQADNFTQQQLYRKTFLQQVKIKVKQFLITNSGFK